MRGFGVESTLYDPPVVGAVEAGSAAAAAGLQAGDRIVAIDGRPQRTWEEAHYAIALRPAAEVRLRVARGGQELEIPVRTEGGSDMGRLAGVFPLVRVGEVTAGAPAQQAGIRSDDGILRIGDTAVRSFTDLQAAVGSARGPLDVKLFRDGRVVDVQVAPRDLGQGLGITSKVVIRKFGFVSAVRESLAWTWDMTVKTFDVLGRLVTAQLSPRTIMGPLGIAQASGNAARQGAGQWFFLMAAISLQVGILNMFPLAPLDGGHLAILAGESVVRRDISPNAKAWIINAGALLLFALIGLVLYSDIAKTGVFGRLMR
jgi:regulator of sigma E protease